MDTKELQNLNLLHYSPFAVNRGVFDPPFSVVHDHLLCLAHVEGELNDGVGVVLGHTVVGEQGVQEGTTHAPLIGVGLGFLG